MCTWPPFKVINHSTTRIGRRRDSVCIGMHQNFEMGGNIHSRPKRMSTCSATYIDKDAYGQDKIICSFESMYY